MSRHRRCLDFGCGNSKTPGFEGADRLSLPGVDYVFDFDSFPYPLPDETFSEIWADQVLEHLSDPVRVMEEFHRICVPNALVRIGVPYFRGPYAWIDPTHQRGFSVHFPRYFSPDDDFFLRYRYTTATFATVNVEFDREWRRSMRPWHSALVRCAEKCPHFYEAWVSHLLPLNSLTFTMRVIK